MGIHSSSRLERLPKLSGSALSLLFSISLQPRARASTRLSANHSARASRLQSRPNAVVVLVLYTGSITPTQEAVVG